MNARPTSDFVNAIEAKRTASNRWDIRGCSMCSTPIGYVFFFAGNSLCVGFDGNCQCVTYRTPLQPREMAHVADQYNWQTHPSIISEYDKWWGFTSTPAEALSLEIEKITPKKELWTWPPNP